MKKQDAGDSHDCRAACKDRRNHGERTTFLEKKEKGDRSRADAYPGENRIENSLRTGLLIPAARQPKKREVD